ncbi:MAG: photosystem II reaction center protein Ycf12 [Synechococcales bacterium]|jgi:hypothetical protein|nr:photosystem II reaction center protein Ycf12 [Cyanobacteria bacterium REEB444]MEB3124150.1 photosystem II reaction center protein Ycf12 [Synechococcales bacterium]NBO30230.1 photosystem II reaction center protein Ycf12 [Cyanobacteria bacterium WB6_1B_304]
MDFLSNLLGGLDSLNIEPLLQLTAIALIMLSGPVIIFLLSARGGNL